MTRRLHGCPNPHSITCARRLTPNADFQGNLTVLLGIRSEPLSAVPETWARPALLGEAIGSGE